MPNGSIVAPLHVAPHAAQSLSECEEHLQINPMCFTRNLGPKIGSEVSNAQSLSLRANIKRLRSGGVRNVHNEQGLDEIQRTMFITQPPCTTIALIVNGLRAKEHNCFEQGSDYNWCTVRDKAGIKLDLVLKTALKMAQGLETPDDVEMFCAFISFCAPLTDVEKAVWEDKNQRVERHSQMVRDLVKNGGIAKGTRKNDIKALWEARMAKGIEEKLEEVVVEVASDASE